MNLGVYNSREMFQNFTVFRPAFQLIITPTSSNPSFLHQSVLKYLTFKMPRKPESENVVCLCRPLNILANFSNLFLHTSKQCGPWSDCSCRSSLSSVHTVCKNDFLYHKQTTKQTIVVIGSLRVNNLHLSHFPYKIVKTAVDTST